MLLSIIFCFCFNHFFEARAEICKKIRLVFRVFEDMKQIILKGFRKLMFEKLAFRSPSTAKCLFWLSEKFFDQKNLLRKPCKIDFLHPRSLPGRSRRAPAAAAPQSRAGGVRAALPSHRWQSHFPATRCAYFILSR